jgi:mRNA-degrading endonuclease RelE of RelBE toxin-antitoxin system
MLCGLSTIGPRNSKRCTGGGREQEIKICRLKGGESYVKYDIEFTSDALNDFKSFRKFEQRTIFELIEARLQYEPTMETRHLKRLRPNHLAEWELSIGRFRVFYDVDVQIHRVKVEALGYKAGSKLFIHGEEYRL